MPNFTLASKTNLAVPKLGISKQTELLYFKTCRYRSETNVITLKNHISEEKTSWVIPKIGNNEAKQNELGNIEAKQNRKRNEHVVKMFAIESKTNKFDSDFVWKNEGLRYQNIAKICHY